MEEEGTIGGMADHGRDNATDQATVHATDHAPIGDHRIGDRERAQAIDVLRTHTGAGRLTLDEFSDLAGRVYAAQTVAELEAVGRSLPPGLVDAPPPAPPLAEPPAPAAGAPAGRRTRRFVGIMCGGGARGRWRPGRNVRAFAFWGGVHLDFRYAEFEGPVDVTATAVMGGVTITVAEGTRVDLDGMVLMGGSTNATRNVEPAPGAPVITVHARGLWGGVTVWSKKTRAQREAAAAEGGDRAAASGGRGHRRHALGPGVPNLLDLSAKALHDLAITMPAVVAGAGLRPTHGHRSHRAPRPSQPPRPPREGRERSREREEPGATNDAGAVAPSGTLTMMVTDIVGSTRLVEELGDRRWSELLQRHYELVRAEVGRHGGTEIKAQGDGFLVVFSSARRAILAATEVQRALARAADDPDEVPIEVRIGLHTGEIVDVDGDVLGQNVVVAVRIADEAGPGEIVVSGLTRDLTVSGGDITFDRGCEVELKGLSEPWRVHRVDWTPSVLEG